MRSLLALVVVAVAVKAGATLVLAPVALVPLITLTRRMRRRARQSQEGMGGVADRLDQAVRAMRVIQVFRAEGWAGESFRRASGSPFPGRCCATRSC